MDKKIVIIQSLKYVTKTVKIFEGNRSVIKYISTTEVNK